MKKSAKIIVILLVLFLEFAWWARPRISAHGEILDESYRHDERFAALVAQSDHPSPETKAAFDAEVALLDKHIAKREISILAVVLAFDVVGIYFFWRYEPAKTTA